MSLFFAGISKGESHFSERCFGSASQPNGNPLSRWEAGSRFSFSGKTMNTAFILAMCVLMGATLSLPVLKALRHWQDVSASARMHTRGVRRAR